MKPKHRSETLWIRQPVWQYDEDGTAYCLYEYTYMFLDLPDIFSEEELGEEKKKFGLIKKENTDGNGH